MVFNFLFVSAASKPYQHFGRVQCEALIPYRGDSLEGEEEVLNSRENSFQPGEEDADSKAEDYLKICDRRYARVVGKF